MSSLIFIPSYLVLDSSILDKKCNDLSNDHQSNYFNLNLKASAETKIISGVPFHDQINDYYCGPACLEMVFDFYGPDIPQPEIADVARTVGAGTFTDDMRRASHFSNLSTSVGNGMPTNITGYSNRDFGYIAFEDYISNVQILKNMIDAGYPIIVLQWMDDAKVYGHFRVVIGYIIENKEITHFITHDPWKGSNYKMDYNYFMDLWEYSGYWALFTRPLEVILSYPSSVQPNITFTITASINYLCPFYSSPIYDYIATSCNATIKLPNEFYLAPGETYTKSLNSGTILGGSTNIITWDLIANQSEISGIVSVSACGLINGSTYDHLPTQYPGYDYTDLIYGEGTILVMNVEGPDLIIIVFWIILISAVTIVAVVIIRYVIIPKVVRKQD
ncbi:MAG: C39 family peptidase [Candidatus Hodarchaeota archaeon]